MTGTEYFSSISLQSTATSLFDGSTQFIIITKGLCMSCNSFITLSSHSAYSSLGISEILPSVVTTSPIVECSVITFCVPISAAILNGISSSNHGVITILGCSFSIYPKALGTIYPTQSIILTSNTAFPLRFTSTASSGINFGSVVIIVLPAEDCGNSSTALSRLKSLEIFGITSVSINFFMKVDFPVLTGPTTPM